MSQSTISLSCPDIFIGLTSSKILRYRILLKYIHVHTPMCTANTIALESGSLGPIIRHLSTISVNFKVATDKVVQMYF